MLWRVLLVRRQLLWLLRRNGAGNSTIHHVALVVEVVMRRRGTRDSLLSHAMRSLLPSHRTHAAAVGEDVALLLLLRLHVRVVGCMW